MEIVIGNLVWAALAVATVVGILSRLNSWYYEVLKLGEKRHNLPPGDLGWPFIGNMWTFLRAFRSNHPESFMSSYFTRYGKTGIYKAYMFENPSVICTSPETCRKVLTDDANFKPGWPISTQKLIGEKSFTSLPFDEHKRLRKLTATPINGHEALNNYIPYIEKLSKASLEKWSKMGEFEFLTAVRKLTFQIIMHIFLSSESESVMEALEKHYTKLNYGVRAMAINIPGFAYHKALKARKGLLSVFQSIVDGRREEKKKQIAVKAKKDMMDALLDVEDEDGRKLTDEEIIDVMVMYLNAGHESSGHTITWATILLQEHPEAFQKAKEESERVVKNRPPTQQGLSLKEIREMDYLSKVVDETLRWVSFSLVVFREALHDVNVNEPLEFNPSRWDGFTPKAGSFLPFGAGSRLCPGNDLAKLEISIFLHYFLLGYKLDRKNPSSPSMYLPHRRPKDNCLAKIVKV
ncbi:hypothetical protein V2J09_019566 [Rumex salicifolius]